MADNSFLDGMGLPTLAMTGYPAAKLLGAAGRVGANALRGMAAAPVAAAGPFLYGMGDGYGNFSKPLNGNEKPFYIRDANGSVIPNPDNPLATPQAAAAQAPMAPAPLPAAASPPAAAPSPSPQPAGLPPSQFGPPMPGPTAGGGGFAPTPFTPPSPPPGAGNADAPPAMPGDSSGTGGGYGGGGPQMATKPSLLGFLTGGQGSGDFNLSNFLKGGDAAQSALAASPQSPFWNIARLINGGFGGGTGMGAGGPSPGGFGGGFGGGTGMGDGGPPPSLPDFQLMGR